MTQAMSPYTMALVTGWRHAIPVQDKEQLDLLMGAALLDQDLCWRLVMERDEGLFDDFHLSESTKEILSNLSAHSLAEFAQALIGLHSPSHEPVEVLTKAS